MLKILKSKTIWGAVIAAGAWLINQPVIGVAEVVQAVGVLVATIGARDAIRKSAPPDSPEGMERAADELR